jgi:hypothetical protein
MAVEATTAVGSAGATPVTAAIRKASQLTGAKFSYLLATAKVESNLNPNAAAKTSSAGGLFQFIDRTWVGTLKEAGPLLGYERYADAITRTRDGRYEISDPAMRREIMALRKDPTANALMAGVFTNSNAKHLTSRLGRAPTDGELYMAHFMGANGAARLITAAESNPGAVAAQSFSAAARANRSIFFDKSGRARSFSEVTQNLAGRFDVARSRVAGLTGGEAVQSTGNVAETARVARAYQLADATTRMPAIHAAPNVARAAPNAAPNVVQAAPNVAQAAAQKLVPGERVFHNPYRTAQRPQPVSAAVTELWAPKSRTTQQEQARHIARDLEQRTRPQAAQPQIQAAQGVPTTQTVQAAQTAEAPASSSHGALGLFQDTRPDVRSLFTHGVRG